MDPDRTGTLPFVWQPGFGFESYVEYALDVPMYFLYRDGVYQDATQQRGTFREFLDGNLPLAPGTPFSRGEYTIRANVEHSCGCLQPRALRPRHCPATCWTAALNKQANLDVAVHSIEVGHA